MTLDSECTCSDWSDSDERSKCPVHKDDTGEIVPIVNEDTKNIVEPANKSKMK